jgi:hypothetical protein
MRLRSARRYSSHTTPHSRGTPCPSHASAVRPRRAWGMPGAQCTRSLACKNRKHASKSPRSHRDHPAFPHAMVLTAYFRTLPGDRAFLSPSLADLSSANLTPASRRQDHTTSPSASAPFVRARCLRSRASASIASLPYVRDDRETPLCWAGMTRDIEVIWVWRESEYICKRAWTGKALICPSGIDRSTRSGCGPINAPVGPFPKSAMPSLAAVAGCFEQRKPELFRA